MSKCPRLSDYCGRKNAGATWPGCHMFPNEKFCTNFFLDLSGSQSGFALCSWSPTCSPPTKTPFPPKSGTIPNVPKSLPPMPSKTAPPMPSAPSQPVPPGQAKTYQSQNCCDADPQLCNLALLELESICPEVEDIRTSFMMFDTNGKGYLTKPEVGNFMKSKGMPTTQTELDIIMADLDTNQNGQATLQEYLEMMASQIDALKGSSDNAETAFWEEFECNAGDVVPCPISGEPCGGNVCCPGVPESGGLDFACPSSTSDFCQCSNRTKLQDCTVKALSKSQCTGACDLNWCTYQANTLQSWPQACQVAAGQCDGCQECCDSLAP